MSMRQPLLVFGVALATLVGGLLLQPRRAEPSVAPEPDGARPVESGDLDGVSVAPPIAGFVCGGKASAAPPGTPPRDPPASPQADKATIRFDVPRGTILDDYFADRGVLLRSVDGGPVVAGSYRDLDERLPDDTVAIGKGGIVIFFVRPGARDASVECDGDSFANNNIDPFRCTWRADLRRVKEVALDFTASPGPATKLVYASRSTTSQPCREGSLSLGRSFIQDDDAIAGVRVLPGALEGGDALRADGRVAIDNIRVRVTKDDEPLALCSPGGVSPCGYANGPMRYPAW